MLRTFCSLTSVHSATVATPLQDLLPEQNICPHLELGGHLMSDPAHTQTHTTVFRNTTCINKLSSYLTDTHTAHWQCGSVATDLWKITFGAFFILFFFSFSFNTPLAFTHPPPPPPSTCRPSFPAHFLYTPLESPLLLLPFLLLQRPYLFHCSRATAVSGEAAAESPPAWGRATETQKGERFVKCYSHFSIVGGAVAQQARLRGRYWNRSRIKWHDFSFNLPLWTHESHCCSVFTIFWAIVPPNLTH